MPARLHSRISIRVLLSAALLLFVTLCVACGTSSSPVLPGSLAPANTVTVNTAADVAQPAAGVMTLRAAIEQATADKPVTFDPSLDGATIQLSIVGESHSILKGEVYSGGPPSFQGYFDRDYGKSALYVAHDLVIDASRLPHGITIQWSGGDGDPARVLAVLGNLTLKNVTISGGYSVAEEITGGAQPYTLARGGGLAVWGIATLENCTISGNRVLGDNNSSRDRGTYGGGIYANGLVMTNCIVSGNTATGFGAAAGGIYSVGGADHDTGIGNDVFLSGCTISGNRVAAQHAYGGGVFSLGGGPSNQARMTITNCTIARNASDGHPGAQPTDQYYDRGGGVYLGGGSLSVASSTIAENEVNDVMAMFSGKPNMAGGGIAATVGNAHVVEDIAIWHSIVAGNKMNGAPNDLFTGSLINFYSYGYNRIGRLDFSQILAPAPAWMNLSRKHYPKIGDQDGIALADVVDLSGAQYHGSILSAGTDAGQAALLWYPPAGTAVQQIPVASYQVRAVNTGYTGWGVSSDDFLNHVLAQVRSEYGATLGSDFGNSFGDLTGVTFYGPLQTWPSAPANQPWINFWRSLDAEIGSKLGTVILGDDFWGTLTSDSVDSNLRLTITREGHNIALTGADQRGRARPGTGGLGDIGAIQK